MAGGSVIALSLTTIAFAESITAKGCQRKSVLKHSSSFENNDGLGAMLYKGRLTHSGIGAHLKIAHSKLQKTLRRDRRGHITSNFWPCEHSWQLFAAQTNEKFGTRVSPGERFEPPPQKKKHAF